MALAVVTAVAAAYAASLPGAAIRYVSTTLAPVCAEAAGVHHASVVVTHLGAGFRSPVRVCVGFSESTISGGELLRRSRIEAGFSGAYGDGGSAVCQVDNEPASYPPGCLGGQGPYWSIWTQPWQGSWTYSRLGVDAITIHDGDAEGFRYVDQQHEGPPVAPAGVCPPPEPAAPAPTSAGRVSPGTAATHPSATAPPPALSSRPSPPAVASPSPGTLAAATVPPTPVLATPGKHGALAPPRSPAPPVGLIAGGAVGLLLVGALGVQLLLARGAR